MTVYRVTNTSIVLGQINNHFSSHEISESQRKSLSTIAASLIRVLNDVDRTLGKYTRLDSKATSLKGHLGRTWDRVTFDNEEIRDLRSRLVSTLETLTSFLNGLDRKVMMKLATTQAKTLERQDWMQDQEILDWLVPADYSVQSSSILKRCLTGSGQWILNSPEYQRWLHGKGELLFLPGVPGTGKTFLSAIIIDNIPKSAGTGLCYYYCDYNRAIYEQLCNTLTWFLRQLAHDTIPLSMKSMFEKHYRDRSRPTLQSIREALLSVINDFETVWIVVDALDEYSDASQTFEFVQELLNLNKAAKVNVLVTSRPIPDISNHFTHGTTLEVRARDGDMSSYIDANIRTLPKFVTQDLDLQKEIKDSIIKIADGIFLLVALNLQSLRGKRSKGHLEKTLSSLKKGTSGYQDAYTKTMERISSQDQDSLAIDALSWIVYAARPLKVSELLHALGTIIDASKFDESFVPDIEDVMSACCGLIHIENGSKIVRLIHSTTVDYLKGDGVAWLKDGHTKLSDVCNTCLAYDDQELVKRLPLYDYASWNWRYHAENRERPIDIEQFAATQQRIDGSSLSLLEQTFPKYLQCSREWPGITGLHLVAISGFADLVPAFLKSYDVDGEDSSNRTPVSYAVEQGHYEVLRVLIKNSARLDFVYKSGETLLTHAVRAELDDILSILVKSRSPQLDVPNKNGCTPLHLAALYRNVLAIHTLLEAGADANVFDNLGCSPLLYAVKLDHSEYKPDTWGQLRLKQNLLNEYGMSDEDLEECVVRMERQNTICAEDYESIVGQLIASGANLTLADRSGRTPIWYAHRQGSLASLAYIYKRSMHQQDKVSMADITYFSNTGERRTTSSLHGNSNLNIVTARLPLDIGVCTDNYKQKTILHTVAANNNISMLIWLLYNSASIHEGSQGAWISSYQMALDYQDDAVNYIPDVDWINSAQVAEYIESDTWFHANLRGSFRVLKLLIQHQALHNHTAGIGADASQAGSSIDVDIEYIDGNAQKCQKVFPIYKELIQRNDWLHAVDKHGQNALHMSIRRGHSITAECLLEHGTDRYARDKYGRTILEYACLGSPGTKLVESILDPGFLECMIAGKNTWSPLHWACRFGDINLLYLLTAAGFTASVVSTKKPTADWTPLDIAVCCENRLLVELDGSLRTDLSWEGLMDSGLLIKEESSGEIVPVLKSSLVQLKAMKGDLGCTICTGV